MRGGTSTSIAPYETTEQIGWTRPLFGLRIGGRPLTYPAAMESERPLHVRDVWLVAGWTLGNLVLLAVIALIIADRRDENEAINSATPVADGALITLTVLVGVLLANGGLLCLAARTRRVGVGVLAGAVVAVPVGLLVVLGFLSAGLY